MSETVTFSRALVRRIAAYVRGFYPPPPHIDVRPDAAWSTYVADMIEAQEHALIESTEPAVGPAPRSGVTHEDPDTRENCGTGATDSGPRKITWPDDYYPVDTIDGRTTWAPKPDVVALRQDVQRTGEGLQVGPVRVPGLDLDMLAKGVRMLGVLPHEHPQAATFNDALDLAATYLRSFIGREEYLPRLHPGAPAPDAEGNS